MPAKSLIVITLIILSSFFRYFDEFWSQYWKPFFVLLINKKFALQKKHGRISVKKRFSRRNNADSVYGNTFHAPTRFQTFSSMRSKHNIFFPF